MSRAGRWSLVTLVLLVGAGLAWWLTRPAGSADDRAGETARDDKAAPAAPGLAAASGRPARSADGASHLETRPAAASTAGWRAVGTVKEPDGKPVADAEVRLMLDLDASALPDAKADAEGRFSVPVPGLDAATPEARESTSVVAWATAPRHKPFGPRWANVSDAKDREVRFEIVLEAGATLRGRIVDAASKPVALADASLCATDRKKWTQGSSDALGRYAIPIPHSGPFSLSATMHGVGAAVMPGLTLDADHDVDVPDLVLRGEGWLEGRCAYPDGSVAAYLHVGAGPPKDDPQPPTETCWTEPLGTLQGQATADAKGRFRMAGLKPGRYVVEPSEAYVHDDEKSSTEIVHSTGDRDVVVTCRTHRLIVRVVDEAGRPAPAWELEAKGASPHNSSSETGSYSGADAHDVLETEPGMKWEMTAKTETSRSETTKLVTPAQPWETNVTLVLRAGKQPRGRIRVSVEGADGKPIPQFRAEAATVSEGAGVYSAEYIGPADDGLSSPLAPGRYAVEVVPGTSRSAATTTFYVPERVNVVVKDGETTPVLVHARLGGRLRVTFRERGAKIPDYAFVALTRPDGPTGRDERDLSTWSFDLPDEATVGNSHFVPDVPLPTREGIDPGRWTLRFTPKGVRKFEAAIDVEAGKTTDVEVLVEPE